MVQDSTNVLLVEDNPGDARLLEIMLNEIEANPIKLHHVTSLSSAQDFLKKNTIDLVLLDLSLPDGDGLDSILIIQQIDNSLPIIILTGLDDQNFAVKSVTSGAQDYLIKGQGDGYLILRAIRYAIERKNIEKNLFFLAHYDSLTGLVNRDFFHTTLSKSLLRAKRNNQTLGLMFLDLDHFKEINDTLGHAAGDYLLISVTKRLQSCVRETDTIARLGGDEFTIILDSIQQSENAGMIAGKILQALAEPFLISEHQVYITSSIGITLYPKDATNLEEMIKYADTAMYKAKEKGRNNYQYFTDSINAEVAKAIALKTDLRKAIKQNQLFLHYQPKVNTKNKAIIGAEALLRWQHPTRGLIPPVEFIPIAEQSGLIDEIGAWVIKEAISQNHQWREKQLKHIFMAINLSAKQFHKRDFVDLIERELISVNMEASTLELEITESLLMKEEQLAQDILRELNNKGHKISIDDFGTGYSSLSYLKRFTVDSLKIDRSFIRDIISDQDGAEIVKAIIVMAHALRLIVIAEGVEEQEQLAFLQDNHCDEIQGYLFSKPVSAEEFENLLRQEDV
jgi:diguanylate cyclase (GGDEF)-like protein